MCPELLHTHRMCKEFGPSLYIVDGPTVPFYGFPYPTRMAVARLSVPSLGIERYVLAGWSVGRACRTEAPGYGRRLL